MMGWLASLFLASSGVKTEINEIKHRIACRERDIEAVAPMVEEAKKQADEGTARLEQKLKVSARRVSYECALLDDLTDGWRDHD